MYNTIVSEMWNTLMGVTGTLESMTGNTAFINKSPKGEAEGNCQLSYVCSKSK